MCLQRTLFTALIIVMFLVSVAPVSAFEISGENIVFLDDKPAQSNEAAVYTVGNITYVRARWLWFGCGTEIPTDCAGERPASLSFVATHNVSGSFVLDDALSFTRLEGGYSATSRTMTFNAGGNFTAIGSLAMANSVITQIHG